MKKAYRIISVLTSLVMCFAFINNFLIDKYSKMTKRNYVFPVRTIVASPSDIKGSTGNK